MTKRCIPVWQVFRKPCLESHRCYFLNDSLLFQSLRNLGALPCQLGGGERGGGRGDSVAPPPAEWNGTGWGGAVVADGRGAFEGPSATTTGQQKRQEHLDLAPPTHFLPQTGNAKEALQSSGSEPSPPPPPPPPSSSASHLAVPHSCLLFNSLHHCFFCLFVLIFCSPGGGV